MLRSLSDSICHSICFKVLHYDSGKMGWEEARSVLGTIDLMEPENPMLHLMLAIDFQNWENDSTDSLCNPDPQGYNCALNFI